MKVYLHYSEDEDASKHSTIKLSLPKSWRTGKIAQLRQVLVENYNKKLKQKHEKGEIEGDMIELVEEDYHLELTDGTVLAHDGTVDRFIKDLDDVYLKPGKSSNMSELGITPDAPKEAPSKKATVTKKALPLTPGEIEARKRKEKQQSTGEKVDDNKLLCKNFGCGKRFDPNDNTPTSCRHHIKPPIFHETRKYWACCPDQIAWDWDSFQAIPGCTVSACNSVREGKSFLGGQDVREQASGPQRIDQGERKESALDKISALRKALVKTGVSGEEFDDARDRFKTKHEDLGVKVWDKVHEELVSVLSNALKRS